MKGDTTEEDVGNDKDGFFITRSFDYLSGLIKPKKRVTKIKDVAFEQIVGTKKFLHGVDSEIRTRLYTEYKERLEAIAPELRSLGKATGDQMLVALQIPMNDKVEKKWRESLGYVGMYPEMTQLVVNPILQPFCDGLWEPFDEFIGKFKMDLYLYVAAGTIAGAVSGYLIGRQKKG